ncbi:hypothetical protein B0H13DRAFT_1851214 [Mycena leptocephala]|nr:hypothetical protein B0H13DRAFT_1851214 [Mycena leptocephala]
MPPQDDTEILWNFVRCFIAWRDSVARKTQNGPPATAEQMNDIVRQMNYIICSEQAHQEWKSEVLETWGAYRSVQDSGASDPFLAAILKRMLQEAMMISILETKDLKKYWRPIPPIRELPHEVQLTRQLCSYRKLVLSDCRENIQQEWKEIAHDAGAAKIEFINEVDSEEVPPGLGILFRHVEPSYIRDCGSHRKPPGGWSGMR